MLQELIMQKKVLSLTSSQLDAEHFSFFFFFFQILNLHSFKEVVDLVSWLVN